MLFFFHYKFLLCILDFGIPVFNILFIYNSPKPRAKFLSLGWLSTPFYLKQVICATFISLCFLYWKTDVSNFPVSATSHNIFRCAKSLFSKTITLITSINFQFNIFCFLIAERYLIKVSPWQRKCKKVHIVRTFHYNENNFSPISRDRFLEVLSPQLYILKRV